PRMPACREAFPTRRSPSAVAFSISFLTMPRRRPEKSSSAASNSAGHAFSSAPMPVCCLHRAGDAGQLLEVARARRQDMIVWIATSVVALIILLLLGLVLFTAWTAHQVEANLPPCGKFIDVDGVRLHYVDKGRGPVLLLIHGLSGQVLNFTHSLLGRLGHDFRVVILDRPGSGYSLRPDEALAPLAAQARIISRFCQALGLERPVVVGHSLGGAVALALALDHPDQVGALALIAPVTHRPESVPPPFDGLAIGSPLLRRLIAW